MNNYIIWNESIRLGTIRAPNAETAYKRALKKNPEATHVEEM